MRRKKINTTENQRKDKEPPPPPPPPHVIGSAGKRADRVSGRPCVWLPRASCHRRNRPPASRRRPSDERLRVRRHEKQRRRRRRRRRRPLCHRATTATRHYCHALAVLPTLSRSAVGTRGDGGGGGGAERLSDAGRRIAATQIDRILLIHVDVHNIIFASPKV